MKRFAVVLALVALFLASYFGVQLFLNHAIEQGIETVGPHLTGTSVELKEVELVLYAGKATAKGIVVGNPDGFQTDNAFRLEEVRLDLAPLSILAGTIHVQEIYVGAPEITYEKKGETSNLLVIMRHMQSIPRGSAPQDDGSNATQPEPAVGPTVRIDRFELEGAKVKAPMLKDKTFSVPLPGIKLANLGGPEGAPVAEVSAKVMSSVTGRVVTAVAKRVLSLEAERQVEDDGGEQDEGQGRGRRKERKSKRARE